MKLRSFSPWTWCLTLAAVAALSACDNSAPTSTPAASPTVETPAPQAPAAEGVAAPQVEQPLAAAQQPALSEEALLSRVGSYPNAGNTSYLETGALAERLKLLLGEQAYAVLLQNMDVASPLAQDGSSFYVTGNRVGQGGVEMAAVVADPSKDTLRVWLVHEGKSEVLQDPAHVNVPWPQDVQIMVDNFNAAAPSQ